MDKALYLSVSEQVIGVSAELEEVVQSHTIIKSSKSVWIEVADMLQMVFFRDGVYPVYDAKLLRPIFFDSVLCLRGSGVFDMDMIGYFMTALIAFINGKQQTLNGDLLLSDEWLLLGSKLLKRFGDLLLKEARKVEDHDNC
jgi:hypothetical protein